MKSNIPKNKQSKSTRKHHRTINKFLFIKFIKIKKPSIQRYIYREKRVRENYQQTKKAESFFSFSLYLCHSGLVCVISLSPTFLQPSLLLPRKSQTSKPFQEKPSQPKQELSLQ
jgi:hypothetical protein